MKTAIDAIVYNFEASKAMLNAFTADLSGSEWTHRITPQCNCAAWIVGHLVTTERRMLQAIGHGDLPPLPADFDARFTRENNAPAATEFGDPTILMPLFDKHRGLLIEAVKRLPIEKLDEPSPRQSARFKTMGEFLIFVGGTHVTMHAGQITTIRRHLGRPPLF